MEDLLASQTQIMEAMNQFLINFKKDDAERKTPAHIKKRLSTLESYWQEFQNNHLRLCDSGDKSNEYFTSHYYKKTSDFYNDTRSLLTFLPSESKEKSVLKPATLLQMPGFTAIPSSGSVSRPVTSFDKETSRTQGNSSKLEEMLRRQRSNFKAFQRTISSIDLDIVSEKWEYEDILKSVQSRWTIIDALHWEIDSELYEDDPEYEEMFSSYERKFNEIKKSINSKMWSDLYREKTTPKMDIPVFSGSYHQWLSFKDLFVETIHTNRALSNSQKMQFLKSKLKGEAEKLVQHLHITTDNYQVCWDLLNNRYSNTKLIFNSHMSVLFNQPIMQQQSAISIKRIHDTTNECLNAIKNLGVSIENWDPIIVYIITQKLDADTHNDYIESLKHPRDLPVLKDLLQFLEAKFTALESSKRKQDPSKSIPHPQHISQPSNLKKPYTFKSYVSNENQLFKSNNFNSKSRLTSTAKTKCPVCNKDHAIPYCETFLAYQPNIKRQTIQKLSLCQNCLYNHNGNECFSRKRCHKCQLNHHTLVHEAFAASANTATSNTKFNSTVSNSIASLDDTQEILLATALINVQAVDGSLHTMRALIDQGSQTSIITENGAQRLGLPRKHCKGVILGVGAKENNCKGTMNITLSSCHDSYQLNLDVFIMRHAVNNLPNKSFSKPSWEYIKNIQLADPEFYRSRTIDLLLGVDVYSSIIMGGIIKENDNMPIAQQTRLGWILCGSVKSYSCNVIMVDLDSIHKFWSIEDINENEEMSFEDYQCLQKYKETTFRQSDGKHVVRLPLHSDADEKLGLSEPTACAQFYQLERKFDKNKNLAYNYKQFINECINLGHMHLITKANMTPLYYMPHHAIERPDSITTSLRVVFNASGKTTSGVSLNDVLYRGPNLQQELLILVLKWRQYKYAFTADLEKMFRQIILHPDDQRYQCIVWRDNSNQPLNRYQLSTVTYGTKSAPFLAMMTLKQLAIDERHRFPTAAKALEQHFYMDDALCGSYDVISAKTLQHDLIELLKEGGFNLRKFSSNEKSLLEGVDVAPSSPNVYDFKHQESTKALGLTWIAKDDNFTKRTTT
ncbi:uncharacterized protein LOC123666100 [Melitaea cinxia]|uniref:uncharacterized protein LOC123666100 n=1 Tax=Melitaea cinxia TaxID=113334 RepID=UPI001E26F1B6|nr:uncharacterized protein LOC123666100 [Melitaea cinxia]